MKKITNKFSGWLFVVCFSFIATKANAQAPAPPTVSGNLSVCSGSTTTLTATGASGASFAWYNAATGGSLLSSSAAYTTPALTTATHYYVQQTVSGSTSTRYDAYVLVASIPSKSSPTNFSASPATICQGVSSNLSATVDASAGQYVYWYDSQTGGNLLGSSASGGNFTVSPTATTTYYAQSQAQIITQTFNYTGGVQAFTVPAGVTSINIDARGGRGGYDYECCGTIQGLPGLGGRVQATMNVTPGQVLYIYVGQAGHGYAGSYSSSTAYNGGGTYLGGVNAGGGGGGTDIRVNGQALANRVLVAGGGGGSGTVTQSGGGGGGLVGGNGTDGNYSGYTVAGSGGKGGSQTAGGAGGDDRADFATPSEGQVAPSGSLGQGGNMGQGGVSSAASGGAGGGGYYGGGGGEDYGGGGGGSSYTDPTLCTNVVHKQGYQNGDGQLVITYNSTANCAALTRQPVTVTVNTTPTVSAGNNVITCAGTPVTLTGTGANTYTWTPGNLTGASISVNPASTTTYTVTGTLTNGGCSNTANVTVTVTSVSASANTTICLNQSITLSASGADSYTWQPGNLTGSSVNVSPASTTTYTVTGHNNVGCNTTAQTTVTVNPLPPTSIGTGQTVSAGTSVTLTATGADSYSWSVPYSANTASITFTPAATSTWQVTGFYSATGCSNKATAVITVSSIAAVSGNTQVCPGGTTALTATGTGPFTWYTASTGGTLLYKGATYTTPAINADTAFYVSGNGSARTPIKIYAVAALNHAVATPMAICLGSNSNLSVTPSAQVNWYDAATGGNLLDSAASGSLYSVAPQTNTIYYAQVQTQATTQTFNYTGGVQAFTVPAGVTSINIDARGGRGGYDYECCGTIQGLPGLGGRVQATMNVTPGQVLYIYIGQAGHGYAGSYSSSTAYNGGGTYLGGVNAGGGGGGTDIRVNGQALANRVLVAGGGGGSGTVTQAGGGGGGLVGGNGTDGNNGYPITGSGGKGGTQTAGGAGGTDASNFANPSYGQVAPSGSLGQGGNMGQGGVSSAASGGAGGGGYYGGGGGEDYGGGGGGSSYTDPTLCANVVHTQGYQSGDGQLTITYNSNCTIRLPDSVIVNPLPIVSANASASTIALGAPVTLNGGGASTYLWTNNVQNNIAFRPDTSANYTVTGTDSNGCTNTASVYVTVIPEPYLAYFSPALGGTDSVIIIHGKSFNSATAVSFGGMAAKSFTITSDSTITATIASGTSGDVSVTNPLGIGSLSGFTYTNINDTACACNCVPATLFVPGNNTITWYDALSGGNLLYTGKEYTTPTLSANTSYWYSLNGAPRVQQNIILTKNVPTNVIANPSTIVQGASSNLSAKVATGNVHWYTASAGGTAIGSAASGANFAVSPTSTTTYYAQADTVNLISTFYFNYTGAIDSFIVPPGVTTVNVDASGGSGGSSVEAGGGKLGGYGGRVQASLAVTPGQVLYLNVGGRGFGGNCTGCGTSGHNGGGTTINTLQPVGVGGGASDIKIGGNKVLVAAGGGGAGQGRSDCTNGGGTGGAGGGLTGANGTIFGTCTTGSTNETNNFGRGGTQSAGGAAGSVNGHAGTAGSVGNGGNSAPTNGSFGGGGGGGYFGGGSATTGGGGGGGSSYTDATLFTNVVHTQGYAAGDGAIAISYSTSCGSPRVPVTVNTSIALPITFGDVKAWPVINGINVQWTAFTELGVKQYLIERSADGQNFLSIGSAAAHNSGNTETYNWIDAQPIVGNNYYRIKAINMDGTINISQVELVKMEKGPASFSIYPNPILRGRQLALQFKNMDAGKYSLLLYDPNGKRISTQTITLDGIASFKTITIPSGLAGGYYQFIFLDDSEHSWKQQLIVQ